MPEQFTVSGQIRYSDERSVAGVMVQALDKDLPSLEHRAGSGPQELGRTVTDREGRFTIGFTDERFRRGDAPENASRRRRRQGPDLVFRVSDSHGQELRIIRTSAPDRELPPPRILFNAPIDTQVVIIIEQRDEAEVSEYEWLLAQLTPVLEDLPVAELTDEDLAFLAGELEFDEEHTTWLRLLRAAAVLSEWSGVATEAFYGWARTGLPDLWNELPSLDDDGRRDETMIKLLDQLAAAEEEVLVAHLLRAVEERIIPARIRDRARAIARAIRRRAQREYVLRLRLELAPTRESLVGHTVTTFDADANNHDLGTDVTDTLGEFVVAYFAADNGRDVERALRFRVRGPALAEGVEVTERVRPDATTPVSIRVPLPAAPPTLQQLRNAGRLDVPDAVLKTLEDKHGIQSFADIRRRGGLSRIAEVRALDSAAVRRLDALADLDRLSSDLNETSVLLEYHFDSVAAIAEASRRAFVASIHTNGAGFSERRATELHVAARAQTDLLDQIFAGIAIDFANGMRPPTGFVAGDYFPPFPPEEE